MLSWFGSARRARAAWARGRVAAPRVLAAGAIGLAVASSCHPDVRREVHRIRGAPEVAPRAEDCAIERIDGTLPTFGARDLASVDLRCAERLAEPHGSPGRCAEALREEACRVGADVAHSVRVRRDAAEVRVTAVLALRRTEPSPGAPECAPACSEGFRCERGRCERVCEPACEVGYRCGDAGACVAECNPPCDEGAACAESRVCEVVVVDAGPPDATVDAGEAAGRRRRR